MVYQSLYRKYRPQTFEEILGQEHVARTLANAITEDRVAHAYLFTGPRGTGKTSTARILAKALNCAKGPTPSPCGKCHSCVAIADGSSLDVLEMDAASHSKVDETREILAGVPLATAGGRRKIYVIDEVHMLSAQAFNALLKTLEEPPPHVVFILATTEAHKVLPTIVSRTQRFDFRRVPTDIIEGHLATVAKAEQTDIDEGALASIARYADGSVRDALSVLDQLSSLGARASAHDVERILGERSEDAYIALFDAIAAQDVGSIFGIVGSLIAEGADIRQLAEGALGHARTLLLLATSPGADELLDVGDQDRPRVIEQAQRFGAAGLLRTVDLIWKAFVEMRNAPNHRLLLEVALVRAAAPDTDPSAGGLMGRIERLERRMGIEQPGDESQAAVPTRAAPTQPTPAAPLPSPPSPQSAPPPPTPKAARPTAPPAAQVQPTAPEPAAVPPEIGLGHVKEAWAATMQEVKTRSKTVWALLAGSTPTSFDGHVVILEVTSDFHEGEMGQERNSAVLAESLHASLGIRPRLKFVARSKDAAKEVATHDVADYQDAREPATAAGDPVELVKKGLGAEVVEETGDR